jgi:hypothetical protein
MTGSLDRGLANVYIVNSIEIDSKGVDIFFRLTWISDLSSNKKIGISRIAADIDPNGYYQYKHNADY